MPQDVEYLMNVELMNILQGWFVACRVQGKYDDNQLLQEIYDECNVAIVQGAARQLCERKYELGKKIHPMAEAIEKKEYNAIYLSVSEQIEKQKWKRMLKKILLSL